MSEIKYNEEGGVESVDLEFLISKLQERLQRRELNEEIDEDDIGGEMDYGITYVPSRIVLPYLMELQKLKEAQEYYLVMNRPEDEGLVFMDRQDATYAATGQAMSIGVSTIADAWRDTYGEDGERFKIRKVRVLKDG